MRSHNAMKDVEAVDASWEAARGAVYGAIKWGIPTAMLGGLGYMFSPLYRSLTIQFKVYIQMSGMVFGSMIEADYSIREYEAKVRMQRRLQRDRAMWKSFEEQYGKDEDDEEDSK
ncbi:hypothetical protein QBC46DRAFT_370764 [Diplogelasinospora grovesii]|uniref:Imidazoleglycerol-phosphate dehydratase n=1 Tax=Diplogelasinospora grovesii TaxID=303347 RepID=A0AAN6NHV7_9PEZI|nr:hypothetical protein QBC46DRAFT_370764 [Diplogelasinospora grovesii]